MLLWLLMLGVWTFGVTLFSRHLPREMVARVLGVMGLVSTGFLLFILFHLETRSYGVSHPCRTDAT